MRKIALTAGILALPLSAQAQQAAPGTPWSVIVETGECSLEREIAAPIPVRLSVQTVTGSDSYRLAIAGRAIPKAPDGKTAAILFQGVDSRFERKASFSRLSGSLGNALVFRSVQRDVIDGFAAASSISFDYGAPGVGPFAIPRAKAAIKALDDCVRDQLVIWGADPAQFEPGGKTPVALAPREDWLPRETLLKMLKGGNKHHALFRVGVSPEGTVDGCEMVGTSDLDPKPACAWVQGRRLFTPANNPSGKPVRGAATFDVTLIIRATRGGGGAD
jgi:hypothetical protein